jgi:vacuolar-type H+-ATPase subunit I/STV1
MNDEALTAELMKSVEPDVITPEEPQETIAPADEPAVEEVQTIEEVFKAEEEAISDTVPLATHLETKKQLKDLKRTIKELQDSKGTAEEISDDIDSLTDEYPDLDPVFLKKLTSGLKKEIRKEMENDLKPLREEAKQERINTAFETHFAKALELAPEYKGIANAEVIKTLSLDPKNAKKTFVQIIEDAYGSAVVGRKPMDSTTTRGGHELETVDLDRAARDEKYLDQVLSNPKSKKEYNDAMQSHYRL